MKQSITEELFCPFKIRIAFHVFEFFEIDMEVDFEKENLSIVMNLKDYKTLKSFPTRFETMPPLSFIGSTLVLVTFWRLELDLKVEQR